MGATHAATAPESERRKVKNTVGRDKEGQKERGKERRKEDRMKKEKKTEQ